MAFTPKFLSEVTEPVHLNSLKPELFVELVQVLKDQISQKGSKATLQTLIQGEEALRDDARCVGDSVSERGRTRGVTGARGGVGCLC
ncbi:uncharacterized protein HKW66_Vig0241140 [Vigna angularis]|uniref:Uncharacterized protein n=1 Tax=Phaseolus angularis TaxID=3914 RepID=A0A8T0JJ76_PHAAN|nr:uncharacterized protein HKW66_Vig0241140 [Vigna angularis]